MTKNFNNTGKAQGERKFGKKTEGKNNESKFNGQKPDGRRPRNLNDKPMNEADRREVQEAKNGDNGMICGKNPVIEALKSERTLNKVLVAAGQDAGFLRQVKELCSAKKVPYYQMERRSMDELNPHHRGVIALTTPFEYSEVEDILANAAAKGEAPLIVILAAVEDPHNLGAVMRTAEGMGAHGIIISKHDAAPVNDTVIQVAAGAAEYVPVARVANIGTTIEELKEQGVWVCGTQMEDAQEVSKANLTGPLAIVLGNEGKGLAPLVAKKCDFMVKIPMYGLINSFNVSASAAVLLYEAVRQRKN